MRSCVNCFLDPIEGMLRSTVFIRITEGHIVGIKVIGCIVIHMQDREVGDKVCSQVVLVVYRDRGGVGLRVLHPAVVDGRTTPAAP